MYTAVTVNDGKKEWTVTFQVDDDEAVHHLALSWWEEKEEEKENTPQQEASRLKTRPTKPSQLMSWMDGWGEG